MWFFNRTSGQWTEVCVCVSGAVAMLMFVVFGGTIDAHRSADSRGFGGLCGMSEGSMWDVWRRDGRASVVRSCGWCVICFFPLCVQLQGHFASAFSVSLSPTSAVLRDNGWRTRSGTYRLLDTIHIKHEHLFANTSMYHNQPLIAWRLDAG